MVVDLLFLYNKNGKIKAELTYNQYVHGTQFIPPHVSGYDKVLIELELCTFLRRLIFRIKGVPKPCLDYCPYAIILKCPKNPIYNYNYIACLKIRSEWQ